MSNAVVSLMFALGCAGWVYNYSQKNNGGLAQRSLVAGGVVFVLAFVVFMTIITTIANRFE